MTVFSFRMLAFTWTGLAGAAAIGAGALQASYVPPAPVLEPPQAALAAAVIAAPVAPPVPLPASVPFENRSLLAMLPPPDVRPHPAPHAAAMPELQAALKLPIPPIPPAPPAQPLRLAHAEPRRMAPAHMEPAYDAAAPAYPSWDWGRRLPYPGQFASGRAYYYGGQPPSYYGW